MKAARIVVLSVALAAGGVAALLAGRSREAAEAAGRAAAAKIDTVDVLVAKSDIGMGKSISADDMQWQAWPATPLPAISSARTTSPTPSNELAGAIARAPFVAGEPIREAKLIKAKGSGFMAAILPSGMRAVSTADFAGNRRRRLHPAERPRRRDPHAPRPRGRKSRRHRSARQRDDPHQHPRAGDRPDVEEKNGQKVVVGKTATLELTPGQAETLALARQLGTLSLALRSIADASKATTEADDDKRQARRRQRRPLRRQHGDRRRDERRDGRHGDSCTDPHRRTGRR